MDVLVWNMNQRERNWSLYRYCSATVLEGSGAYTRIPCAADNVEQRVRGLR